MFSSRPLEKTSLRTDVEQEQHIHGVFINKYVGGSIRKSKYSTNTLVVRHCLWFWVQHECGCYPMLWCTVTWLHTTWHGHARTHPIQPPSWRDGLHWTRLFDGHDTAWGMTGRKSPHPSDQKWHMKCSRLSCTSHISLAELFAAEGMIMNCIVRRKELWPTLKHHFDTCVRLLCKDSEQSY